MFTRALPLCFPDFAPRGWSNVPRFFSDFGFARRSHRPCQSIAIRYSRVLIYIRIRIIAEKSIPVLFIIAVRLPYLYYNYIVSPIITYHAVYNKTCIVRNLYILYNFQHFNLFSINALLSKKKS